MSGEFLPPLVAPFLGEHYTDLEALSSLIAPPYDVISPEERQRYLDLHPNSIVRLTLPKGDDPYHEAAMTLSAWRASGVLQTDCERCVYVLRQSFVTQSGSWLARTGLLAAVSVEGYETGRVKPHERTHTHVKEDRLALLRATRAMFEALLFLAPDDSERLKTSLSELTACAPLAEANLGGVLSEIWRIGGSAAWDLSRAAQESSIYIADGHHRYETASVYRSENLAADRTLGLIVPLGDPGLAVLPTHRLVSGGRIDPSALRKRLEPRFEVAPLDGLSDPVTALESMSPDSTKCVVLLAEGKFCLQLKHDADIHDFEESVSPAVAELDVARVDALVVAEICRVAGSGAEVSYSADVSEVVKSVRNGHHAAGVVLTPTSVKDVLRVADAGAFMPQKATYFSPKVPSGIVLLPFGEHH